MKIANIANTWNIIYSYYDHIGIGQYPHIGPCVDISNRLLHCYEMMITLKLASLLYDSLGTFLFIRFYSAANMM